MATKNIFSGNGNYLPDLDIVQEIYREQLRESARYRGVSARSIFVDDAVSKIRRPGAIRPVDAKEFFERILSDFQIQYGSIELLKNNEAAMSSLEGALKYGMILLGVSVATAALSGCLQLPQADSPSDPHFCDNYKPGVDVQKDVICKDKTASSGAGKDLGGPAYTPKGEPVVVKTVAATPVQTATPKATLAPTQTSTKMIGNSGIDDGAIYKEIRRWSEDSDKDIRALYVSAKGETLFVKMQLRDDFDLDAHNIEIDLGPIDTQGQQFYKILVRENDAKFYERKQIGPNTLGMLEDAPQYPTHLSNTGKEIVVGVENIWPITGMEDVIIIGVKSDWDTPGGVNIHSSEISKYINSDDFKP